MPNIQDEIVGLNSHIQDEFTDIQSTNKISADDVKVLGQKTVAIATIAGAKFAENDATDAAQNQKDAQHDAALSQNDATDATQTAQLVENQSVDTAQSGKIVALESAKQAAQVFFVDRRFTNQSEMIAQDAAAVQGSMEKPFATPFSAKKAAIAYLLANPSKQAIIEIAKGNTFTSADYVASEHDVTVSMVGVDYVSGVELAFHGISYYFEGNSSTETPLMNPVFLSAQAETGLAAKKAAFVGGLHMDLGTNFNSKSNIYLDFELAGSATAKEIDGDAGIKFCRVSKNEGQLIIGNYFDGHGDTSAKESLVYYIGEALKDKTFPMLYLSRLENKDLTVDIGRAYRRRRILHFGNGDSSVAGDGTSIVGAKNCVVHVRIGQIIGDAQGVGGGSLIEIGQNIGSKYFVDLPDLGTLVAPQIIHTLALNNHYGNTYHFTGKSLKINNPTSTELPFSLALDTSVLILENWDIESNVNAPLFTLTSGKLILRNCKVKQVATGQPIFNIATGATLVLENCQLVHADRVTPLSTGLGKIVSKKSTSNVAIGTAVLRGDLSVSKWYDETLNQSDLVYTSISVEGEAFIANPDGLRIQIKDKGVLASMQNSLFEMATGSIYVENRTSDVSISAGNLMTVEYALLPNDYILGE